MSHIKKLTRLRGFFSEVKYNCGHLAGKCVKRPVVGVGCVAEERQRQHEQFVGERQVPDVVVTDGTGPDFVVLSDDVNDEGVADQAEHEGNEVDGQSDRAQVFEDVPRGVVEGA